jgi:4-amino-4-deoxy-L-arabinose transferase-like glycosyltransferase
VRFSQRRFSLNRFGCWLGAGLAGGAGLIHLLLLLYIFISRLTFPLDLEWEEGGMLTHSLRILEGQSLYGPPTADFISFLYTPFYPFVIAVFGKVFGLSYVLGRLISVLSFFGVLALVFSAVWRQVGRRSWLGAAWGLAAVGLIASSFPECAAWYDLVRNDSFFILLVVGALYLLFYGHRRRGYLIAAGILMGLSFLTKQTGSLFVLYSGAVLLLLNWRKLPGYVVSVGLVAGGTTLVLDQLTDGWFWRIIFTLHQKHEFFPDRIWPETEKMLFKAWPVVAIIIGLWILIRLVEALALRRWLPGDRGNLFFLATAAMGVLVSAIGFATQWAVYNAFIPAFVFSAAFVAMACGDLAKPDTRGWRRWIAGPASVLLGGAIAAQMIVQLYDPMKHIPTDDDWKNSRQLIATLGKLEAPLLIPYHPFYPYLVGQKTSHHKMSTNDITRAGMPLPKDLVSNITKQRYRTIIFDRTPVGSSYGFMLRYYKIARVFSSQEVPRVLTGFRVQPKYVFVPKEPDPLPKGARRVFGFEDGTYKGWKRTGYAFGARPLGGAGSLQGLAGPYEGSYLAGSFVGGDRLTGKMKSPTFTVDRPLLTYRVGGGKDSRRVYVRLLVDGKEVHRGTGTNHHILTKRRVDVSKYLGRKMRVELVDNSRGTWGFLLFDDLQLRPSSPSR